MVADLWDKTLKVLAFDSRVSSIYDTFIATLKEVYTDKSVIVLEARDDYSLGLIKGNELSTIINDALNSVNGSPVTVQFIKKGDENSLRSSVISGKKVASQTKQISCISC